MENENKQVTVVEPDLYDCTVDGIAEFAGILAGVMTRYALTGVVLAPQNDTIIKRVFRESGIVALSMATMGITTQSIKTIGAYLKPFIMQKR